MIIEHFMDSLEEFADAVKFPTASYTYHAFLVSLVFTCVSVITELLGISTLVQWQEALTCNILLLIVSLIDSSTRATTMNFVKQTSKNVVDKVQMTQAKASTIVENRRYGRGFEGEEDYVDDLEYDEYDEFDEYEVEGEEEGIYND